MTIYAVNLLVHRWINSHTAAVGVSQYHGVWVAISEWPWHDSNTHTVFMNDIFFFMKNMLFNEQCNDVIVQ